MSNLKKSVSLAIGATFAAGLATTPFANAAENPFGMQNLNSGYMQVAEAEKEKEGKCGEGKCGEAKKAAEMKKATETKEAEGKCGEGKKDEMSKDKEGKCGEKK
jgi:uncharacterized low-complexity protein